MKKLCENEKQGEGEKVDEPANLNTNSYVCTGSQNFGFLAHLLAQDNYWYNTLGTGSDQNNNNILLVSGAVWHYFATELSTIEVKEDVLLVASSIPFCIILLPHAQPTLTLCMVTGYST
eukprot:scaffold1145_cov77-Skeletonema_dohrnii-CCMP3373.AAC.3